MLYTFVWYGMPGDQSHKFPWYGTQFQPCIQLVIRQLPKVTLVRLRIQFRYPLRGFSSVHSHIQLLQQSH